MTTLRTPGLGPIVGATTDTTCRLWIRADTPGDQGTNLDENRRTVGVIGVVEEKQGEPTIGRAWYFRLPREFDRTGTFRLGTDVQLGFYPDDYKAQGKPVPKNVPEAMPMTLAPDTGYVVRLGTLTIDDPLPNEENLPDWKLFPLLPKIEAIKNDLIKLPSATSEARFRTFPANDKVGDSLSFLLGSCRYPGLLWKIKEADRIFGPMQEHFKTGELGDAARFTMMCGDQIYADELNRLVPILRADTYAEFQERYIAAFGAPNLRDLLRYASTYMILDDHEIEDGWTQDRIRDDGKHKLFNLAIGSYMSYQWSHGPRTWGRLLYYRFDCAGYPFFVLDTRTQRMKNNTNTVNDKGLRDNHLLGYPNIDPAHPGQLKLLLDWLLEQQTARGNVPKFIVSSTVFVPNPIDERIEDADGHDPDSLLFISNKDKRDKSDSWPAFPNTRRTLLEHIVTKNIQNVVFLSGDVHCSNVAEMDFEGTAEAKALKAFSVTSSAFYWPFPFANGDPNSLVHDSRLPEQVDPFPLFNDQVRMHYRSFNFTQEDNFSRLDIDRKAQTVTVRVFDRDGANIVVDRKAKKPKPLVSVLKLAPW